MTSISRHRSLIVWAALCGCACGLPWMTADVSADGSSIVFHRCPPHADVFLDGTWIGTVPEQGVFSLSAIPAGHHRFVFKVSVDSGIEKEVTCQPGQALTIELPPSPAPAPVIEPPVVVPAQHPPAAAVVATAPHLQPAMSAPVRPARQIVPTRHQAEPATTAAPPPAPVQQSSTFASIQAVSAHAPSPPSAPVIELTPAGGLNSWLLTLSIVCALGLGVLFLQISRHHKLSDPSATDRLTGVSASDDNDSIFNACDSGSSLSNEPEFLDDLRWREMMAAKGFRVFRGKDLPEHFIEIEEVKHERPS
ncbi:MAG TPA: hypothetical protein PLY66_09235 [Acidobacteriota bacterium]|nr:hypothetical protein [Acidobacteriota bacterium]HOT01174.1 hypothetical protein [Acidobacteriota bacterium]HQF86884.1 hypothetical protein [Acidobacteriota bacterium]HQG91318.1 hypothetical protein [Acidobacteriota bacterium]HQK86887.1 hypothetical protein [Acidobacteriota bacterium]